MTVLRAELKLVGVDKPRVHEGVSVITVSRDHQQLIIYRGPQVLDSISCHRIEKVTITT